ncbi:uclacyanin 1-like [Cynara cardunculus var. scolymus]|uniref:Blue (Type 1) copper domain-containing protein n=1 Tax=Cynara cardunculus var. scolymus TaxID=59895 RepID=A0A118JXB1_CYNCS|nr:uclacyanin 1-like [Cynara cardunculus var. scolymus]KVH95952.1 Blue (type 1) copper domain-containing protein [Cynara cardunculus var. scolymus]
MGRATMMRILTSLVAITMLVGLALAVDHDVGSPNGGWDTSTDLGSWASSETFTVGDNIVFSYTPNHNVLEVSEADFDSCSTSGPISTNALTPTTIALTAAGSRYFICGTPGHCGQGMKVEIKTVAASSSAPPTTTTPSPTPTTTPSPTPTTTTPPSSTPPVSTTSPPSSSSDTPSPPISTPETPVPPSPSSAETLKVGAVFMMGFGVLMMV